MTSLAASTHLKRNRSLRVFVGLFVAAILMLLGGCATTQPTAQITLTGDPLVDYQAQLEIAPNKDKVLWQYRLASVALKRGELALAKTNLDDALATVAANYGNINAAAAKSRGLFTQEASKPFVGESYERVIANFYRGLIYWTDGQPDNARALFRTGQLLDSDAVNKNYAGDYVLLDYLDGYISARLSGNPDSGADALSRARASAKIQGRPTPPDYDLSANVFVFVDYSAGPRKYAGGSSGQQLLYAIPNNSAVSAVLTLEGHTVALPPYDDIGFQAVTRGGRVMDQILSNKANFKEGANAVGNLALTGAIVSSNVGRGRETNKVSGTLLAIGLAAKLLSAATQAKADTRYWDNLPRFMSFAALNLAPGTYNAELSFIDEKGRTYTQQTQHFTITVPDPTTQPIGTPPKDVVIYRSQLRN